MSEQLPLMGRKPAHRPDRLIAYLDVETVCPPARDIPRDVLVQLSGDRDTDIYGATCAPIARVACVSILLEDVGRWLIVHQGPADFSAEDVMKRFPPNALTAEGRCVSTNSERELLIEVHEALARASMTLVTFNGRRFDYPVLVHRAVALGVRPATCVLKAARESRYNMQHEDLFEEMSFHGASTASLRAYALGMGLADPKKNGDGSQVAAMVAEGRWLDLCAYNLSDCVTLRELRRRWRALVD